MKIKPNVPIEVRQGQYLHLIQALSSSLFHRTENGRYFIKLTGSAYALKYAKHYLESTEIKK